MSLILCLSSGLHLLLGLFLCLPNLWLIPILPVPFLLTCFHLCPALSLMTRTYPHVLHLLLGLFLCLPDLWLIPILPVPFLLTCFHLCPALSLMTRTYPHVLLLLQKSFPHSLLFHLPLLVSSLQGSLGEDRLSGESPLEGAFLGDISKRLREGLYYPL